MRRFYKTKGFKISIAIFTVLLIGAIFAAVSSNGASPFSSVMGTVYSPVQRFSSFVSNGFGKLGDSFESKSESQKKIDELENEISKYQSELADYEKTKQKVKLYEDFLDVKEEHNDYEVTPASIIGRDSADLFYSIVLNKGKSDGIKVNDPVICGKAQLVGVVTKVSPTYCVVSTVLDPNVNVSAYEVRTRETGYVTTSASLSKKKLCKISGLDRSTAIAKGGIVCTSGVGGIYPRDLIIGTVKEVKNDNEDISSYATVKPGFDITDIQDVLVLTAFNGQGVTVSGD